MDSSASALAAGPIDDLDDLALGAVRRMFEALDPMPDQLVPDIHVAITLAGLQAEVARITTDEAMTHDLAGARAEPQETVQLARTVTFSSDSLSTMLTLTPDLDGTVRVDGWAAPGAGLRVEARVGDEVTCVTADEDGRFVIDALARGLAQFILRPAEEGARPVLTPVIAI